MNIHQVGIEDLWRFWLHVDRKGPDECWLYSKQGTEKYSKFSIKKKKIWAHRFAYLIHNRELPEDLKVIHSCDVGRCVNPAHLSLGTQQQNMQDCASKGRHGKSVLSPEEVAEI